MTGQKGHAPTSAERMAPHSVEAEEATLGSLLLNGAALDDVRGFLEPEHFFIVRNGWIFEAICALDNRRENIDYLTVVEELRNAGRIDDIGGAAYITYLINHTPASIYVEAYARIVQRAAVRRRLLQAASQIANAAYDEARDIDAVLDISEEALYAVTAPETDDDLVPVSTLVSADMDRVMSAREAGKPLRGVPTGFTDIDRMFGGFKPSTLSIIAGRPGMGKSSWLLSVGRRAAAAGEPVALFTLEMSKEEVTRRLVSAETGISLRRIEEGNLDDSEWSMYVDAVERITRLPLYIDDGTELTPWKLRTKARRAVRRLGVKLVMIDYLQLMVTAGKSENRTQEIAQITRGLKLLAKELHTPILSAAQLNREVEKRADKRPLLSDLAEGGSIENDSDMVMFIHREDAYNDDTGHPNQADIIIAKNRNGPTGTVPLYFRKETTQFANLAKRTANLTDAMHAANAAPAPLHLGE